MDNIVLSAEWKTHYETELFVLFLESEVQRIMEGWLDAAYVGENESQTIHLNAKYMGMAEALRLMINVLKDKGE